MNYLELGIDVGISGADSCVHKIVLRANHPEDANFAFYDRCWFSLTQNSELGQAGVITPLTLFSDAKKLLEIKNEN